MTTTEIINKTKRFLSLSAEILTRAAKPLGRILSLSLADERVATGTCLSVHLGCGRISVAYGSRFLSRISIEGTRQYPFEAGKYPSPENLASVVHLAINDFKAVNTDITLVVPKAWVIMKTADFPLVVKETLPDVVSYELDRLTPLHVERTYYDYRIIGEDKERLQILLAVLKAETLDPYLHAFSQKGIPVKRVIISLTALGALSHHAHGGKSTLFLDLRTGGYDGGLIDEGRLTAAFTGNFLPDAEPEKTPVIAAAINPLLDAGKKEDLTPTVFIDSEAEPPPLLPERIHAPVRFLRETDLKLRFLHREKVIPYPAVGGVLESLRTELRGINLLDKGIHKPSRIPLALTIFLLIALVTLGLFSLAASLQIETKRVEAVEHEIAARSNEVRQIEALKKDTAALEKEINTIEQFKTKRRMVLNLFKELTLILPKNTWLASIRITDSTVNIDGFAASATDILPKLEASPYFQKVEFVSQTFRDVRMNADRFAIKMEIEGLAEEKGKNEKKQ